LRPKRICAGIWPAMHEVTVATVVARSWYDTPDGWGVPVWGHPRDHEARTTRTAQRDATEEQKSYEMDVEVWSGPGR